MAKTKRIVNVAVNPGEPTDGTGKVCIHFVVRDEHGPFIESHALHPAFDEEGNRIKQQVIAQPTRMRLACDRRRQVAPITRNGVVFITHRTEEASATTCPKCRATGEWKEAMDKESGQQVAEQTEQLNPVT